MNKQMSVSVEPSLLESGVPMQPRSFSMSDVVMLLVNRRWIILLTTLLIASVGTYVASRLPVTYSAQASVALNPNIDMDKAVLGDGDTRIDAGVVESEIEVIRSRNMVGMIVDDVGLGVVKEWLSDEQPIVDPEVERTRLTDAIIRSLSVLRKQSSYVIDIEATTLTPAGATAIANGLTDAYLASKVDHIARGVQTGENRRERRLEQLRVELEQRNRAVADFMTTNGLASINGSTMVEQMILETQRNLTTSRNELYDLDSKLAKLRAARQTGGATDGVSEIDSSPVLNRLRIRESEVRGKIADLREIYGPQHTQSIAAASELRDILGQIELEVNAIAGSLERSAMSAQTRVDQLEQELRARQADLNGDERARVMLSELQREADTTAQMYRDLLLKSQDLSDRASRQTATATLLSRAVKPERPSSPPLPLWAGFFVGAGLFLGLGAAVLSNLVSNKIMRTEDIERSGSMRTLVAIPHLQGKDFRQLRTRSKRTPSAYIAEKPLSQFSEGFRMVLTEITMQAPSDTARVIAITSAMAGDGKTTSSLCIGRVAAMSGLRVAIIDCDVRQHALTESIAARLPESLVPLFVPGANISSAFVEDAELPSLHIFPLGASSTHLESSVVVNRLWSVLDPLRESYDLILLDCAPVLAVADTRLFTATADATVIVCRWNRTPIPALNITVEQVNRAGCTVLGVVLNAVQTSVARHYSFSDTLYLGQAGKGYYTS